MTNYPDWPTHFHQLLYITKQSITQETTLQKHTTKAKKMRNPSFPHFFFFFSIFITVSSSQGLINSTCKAFARSDPNINYGFCATSLQAAPASQCASLHGLGMISIRLVRYNVTDTRCFIKQLLMNKKWDPYVRQCLNDCFDLFSDAIPTVKQVMKYYNARQFDDANVHVSSIMDAATTCEDGFKDRRGVVSPLTKRNDDTFQLSAMVLSVMSMIKTELGWFCAVFCVYCWFLWRIKDGFSLFLCCLSWSFVWWETGISRFYCKYAFGDKFLCFLTSNFSGMSNLHLISCRWVEKIWNHISLVCFTSCYIVYVCIMLVHAQIYWWVQFMLVYLYRLKWSTRITSNFVVFLFHSFNYMIYLESDSIVT